MKLKPIRIVSTQIRPRLHWILLLVGLLLALWEMPLANVTHRQTGTRGFLRTVLQNEPSTADRGLPTLSSSEVLEPAMSHLSQANSKSETSQASLNTYRTLGVVELAANNPIGAQQWLLRRLETASTDVLARYFLGEAYLRLGDTQAAIEQWEMAGAHQQLIWLAQDLAERGALTEALRALKVVMRLDATNLEARWLAAEIYQKQGNAERALALCQEIIALDPQSVWARQLAVEIWREQGNIERAMALSQEIIAIAPDKPVGYAFVGLILFDQGQYEQAVGSFEQTVQRYSTSPRWLLVMLGRAYAAVGRWPEAIEAYEQAIKEDPTHHWGYALMGDAQCQVSHPEDALSYYELAIASGNQNSQVQQVADYIARTGDCPPGLQFH